MQKTSVVLINKTPKTLKTRKKGFKSFAGFIQSKKKVEQSVFEKNLLNLRNQRAKFLINKTLKTSKLKGFIGFTGFIQSKKKVVHIVCVVFKGYT